MIVYSNLLNATNGN